MVLKGNDFNGAEYKRASRHQKEWGNRLIDELDLHGDERIIDLGCGDGVLTKRLAELVPEGSVIGIDSSPSMIAQARKLEGRNIQFELLDIDRLDLTDEFDLAFSNAALHWVKDHDRLLDNVRQALVDGGKVRFNFAADGNCSNFFAVGREVAALPRYRSYFEHMVWPWYMPTVHDYEKLVERKGFSSYRVWGENADRYFIKDELVRWIDQPSLVPFLALVDEHDKKAFRDEVVASMVERTRASDGQYFETFRRINLFAVK